MIKKVTENVCAKGGCSNRQTWTVGFKVKKLTSDEFHCTLTSVTVSSHEPPQWMAAERPHMKSVLSRLI